MKPPNKGASEWSHESCNRSSWVGPGEPCPLCEDEIAREYPFVAGADAAHHSGVSHAPARPRILDLFCGAGGAARGYHAAGWDVTGVDIEPQPNYPHTFLQRDAIAFLKALLDGRSFQFVGGDYYRLEDFAAIHASPPCSFYTELQSVVDTRGDHEELITPLRELLEATGLLYVIENVPGAHHWMRNPVRLCGSAFELGAHVDDGEFYELRRHRLFETNFGMLAPGCWHRRGKTIGLYGDHARFERRYTGPESQANSVDSLRYGSEAMGIDWMTWDELKDAIPPAYTELIGHQLLAHLRARAAA